MFAQRKTVEVTTDTSGAATEYSAGINGRIFTIRYVKPGSGGFTDGVDFTITANDTGETIWAENDVNASTTVAPRQATHGTDGTASLYAATGEPVEDYIVLVNDTVKIVIASGGGLKTGTFEIVVG